MAAKKSVRRYHHGDLKAALKDAALRLVRERGPRGFSLNEASRLAGVTPGAPYRHFEDKGALLAEIACEGNIILLRETQAAVAAVTGVREQMLAAGMAYLRFSRRHEDYFAVLFGAGIDKTKHPEVHRTGMEAFGVLYGLALRYEASPELAVERATSAWALVHGLATLSADGALVAGDEFAEFERLLERFLG